ncbi:MAG: hypothetical protein RR185_09980 [Angelakisella sp.]
MACTNTRKTASTFGSMITLPKGAGTFYEGALVAIAAGKAVPAAKATGQPAIGMAYLVTDTVITVERGAHLWDNDATNPVTDTHICGSCYIVDDCTVSSLSTGSSVAGKVLGFEDNQVIVETL